MKNTLYTLAFCSLTVGASQAAVFVLDLPPNTANIASGSSFTTSATLSGATFDISYTLNAVATDTTITPFIRSDGSHFGVGSTPDGTNPGQQRSIDAGDGEKVSITNLSITNFNAGTSGLTQGDFSISFEDVGILNGNSTQDGVNLSFIGFGNTTANVTRPGNGATPALIDLTALTNYDPASTALYLEPDNANGSNRWSINAISVDVTAVPEPSTFAMLGLGGLGLILRRRK